MEKFKQYLETDLLPHLGGDSVFCLTFGVYFRAGRLFFIVEIRDFSARFFQLPGGRLHPAPKCVKVEPDKIF